MAKRNIYLQTIPPAEAVARAKAALDRTALIRPETVPTHEALGRVTTHAVHARYSSPTFHSAAMDGIAVRAERTFGARDGKPLVLRAGEDFTPVNTGHALPNGCNAVIMIERVVFDGEGNAAVEAPAFPWQHVRRIGEDIVATELLLPRSRTLSAYDIGALLSAGIFEVEVWEKVRMVFIPTGDEVLDFLDRPTPGPGQVVESNSQVFAGIAHSWGAEARREPPVPDDETALTAKVRELLDGPDHVVVVGAGSSAGSKDFTRRIFENLGEVLVHGIAVMPGKPSLLGVAKGKLLVGAPGYPVSSVVCFEDLLAPIVGWLQHAAAPERTHVPVRLTRKTPSRPGMEEIVRLAVGRVGGGYAGSPLARGAGLLTTLTSAQAVARIPASSEGLAEGVTVDAELLVPLSELDRVLMHVGSHDNTLDLLTDELMGGDGIGGGGDHLRLVSTHVGSMGGLAALKTGAALFAGCHLFDPESGDFNFPFLERYLPGVEVAVINLAIRQQGLIVPKGNPKGISGVADLTRRDVRFINRQRGAGTRILLDHRLKAEGIAPKDVKGYGTEEFTHMAVAVNVRTGAADCGMGIMAAARALDLDFVPVARERYDLIIPRGNETQPGMAALLDLIRTEEFQARIRALGGYDTALTGRVMSPGMGLPAETTVEE